MKKIISVIMVVLCLAFAGCNKTDSNVSYNSENETDVRHTQSDATEEKTSEISEEEEESSHTEITE